MAQTTLPQSLPAEPAALPLTEARQTRRQTLIGVGLLTPAALVALCFSIVPLFYLVQVSLTRGSSFFFTPEYTFDNFQTVGTRYVSTVWQTLKLASLASLLDLVFGYPFAYILIRKVRYREFARTMMTFPLFGPLYLAFGMFYILLPNGPFGSILQAMGINVANYLFSLPATLFAMAVFTFPFMVMNMGAALSNVDPVLEEAAKTLGAKPWQIFTRVLFPLSRGGILAGFLMCFGWNLGVFAQPLLLGRLQEQNVLSVVMYDKGLIQFDYGLAAAMGVVLMALAFFVTWLSLRFSRGALGT
ncbi:MAG: ABC transporter permease subunit [Thermomicrobiales bacterium]|nr:ABC transporter permease subunit [Thermomicrobiales bacterium]